jgi:hypothetical protein
VIGQNIANKPTGSSVVWVAPYGTNCAHKLPQLMVVPGSLGWLSNIAPPFEGRSRFEWWGNCVQSTGICLPAKAQVPSEM